jgi:lysophospholipase
LKLDGLRGLVLETFGAGNAPSGQDNAMINVLAAAIRRGIVIVNVTQCELYPAPDLYERKNANISLSLPRSDR